MVVFKGQGHWWLPGKEDTKVPGVLTFDTETDGTLSLIGALSHWTEHADSVPLPGGGVRLDRTREMEERAGSYPRIYGGVGQTAVTLDDCFQTHMTEDSFRRRIFNRTHQRQSCLRRCLMG